VKLTGVKEASIALVQNNLLTQEFNTEVLKEAPQVKTHYGLYIYKKQTTVLIKAGRKKGSKDIVETKYVKVNRKPYKNLTWLNRMYDKRKGEGEVFGTPYLKVITPLEFPDNYKIYDQNGEYYGTVIQSNDIFTYIVTRFNTTPTPFMYDTLQQYYIWAQDNKYGLTVPLEFVEKYERPD